MNDESGALGDEPGVDERSREGDHAGGVTARVCDALGVHDGVALLGVELGESVDPIFGDAVGGGRVDDDGGVVGDEGDSLDGGVIGKAEDGGVGGVEELGALDGVLAIVTGEGDDFDVVPGGEAVSDLESGGARLAVDEDFLLRRGEHGDGSARTGGDAARARETRAAAEGRRRGRAQGGDGHYLTDDRLRDRV